MMADISIYRQFLEHCDNGFVEITKQGRVVSANKAVSELCGRDIDEICSGTLQDIFEQDTAEEIAAIISEKPDDGPAVLNGNILQDDGDPRWSEITIFRDDVSGSSQFWLLIKNKAFRKEIEQKLHERELILHTTLESLPFDFWINDNENRNYMQNSYSRELWGDAKGKHPSETTSDEEILAQWLDATERALNGEVYRGEISYIIDGRKKYFKNILAPIKDDERTFGILGMNIDITDLKDALNARDMLLREIHHRVKNNLQMVLSIINLEASTCRHSEDEAFFDDLISRVEAILLIHDKLYRTNNNNIVHASDYFRDLIDHLVAGVTSKNIQVVYELEDVDIEIEKIILLGLIVNELVTNSIKYASAPERENLMFVSLEQKAGEMQIVISDNGPGLPDGLDPSCSCSLGLKMVNVLVDQLGGRIEMNNAAEGFSVFIRFPISQEKERPSE